MRDFLNHVVFGWYPYLCLTVFLLGSVVRFDREINRHLAFGGGVHRCLGSHLARQELRVALREWHLRYPDYAVAEGHELQYTPAIRSIEHFPMVLG